MNQYTKKFFFAFVLVSLVAASCKDDPTPIKTKTQILCSVTWRMTGGVVDDDPISADACYDDDKINFYEDGTMRWRYGANKCEETEPNTFEGKWEFRENETEFAMAGHDEEFDVLELTEEIFRIELSTANTILIFQPVED